MRNIASHHTSVVIPNKSGKKIIQLNICKAEVQEANKLHFP